MTHPHVSRREFLARAGWGGLAATAALSVSGRTPAWAQGASAYPDFVAASTKPPKRGGILTRTTAWDPPVLDPRLTNSVGLFQIYSLTGNRMVMIEGGARTTYTSNAGNQLVTAQAASGTTSYGYDANGNLTLANAPTGRTTSAWDVSNRVTQVILPSGTRNTFTYDGDGKRVMKQDSTGTTKQVWDLENILEETERRPGELVLR